MIHYDLRCERGHAFDGWFKDSANYELAGQTQAGELPALRLGEG